MTVSLRPQTPPSYAWEIDYARFSAAQETFMQQLRERHSLTADEQFFEWIARSGTPTRSVQGVDRPVRFAWVILNKLRNEGDDQVPISDNQILATTHWLNELSAKQPAVVVNAMRVQVAGLNTMADYRRWRGKIRSFGVNMLSSTAPSDGLEGEEPFSMGGAGDPSSVLPSGDPSSF